jgi:hypothetical protein
VSLKTFPAHTLHCDVCGQELTDPVNDLPWWFTDFTDTRLCALGAGWIATADQFAICPVPDDAHRNAVTALMPPEPVFEVEGQLSLDTDPDAPEAPV